MADAFVFLGTLNSAENTLELKLESRLKNGTLRHLAIQNTSVDFCSNDYLGFSRSNKLKKLIEDEILNISSCRNGSGGSRLLTGNTEYTEQVEHLIAEFHNAPAGLIFNSGYDANVGLLSSVPQKGDTVITDELIHASLIDGVRLSYAHKTRFKHNDLTDLDHKLQSASGSVYVVVESLYSMDGDIAPLIEISSLCERYKANLIVDEAHSTGLFGENGSGLAQLLGLGNKIFARVVTFGKALGCHGAIVLGSKTLRSYLINFSRPFIYTTALPVHAIASIKCAYDMLQQTDFEEIKSRINLYNRLMAKSDKNFYPLPSPIKTILFTSAESARKAARDLQEKGLDVRAIVSPTVAPGTERVRICLHAYNTDAEVELLVNSIIRHKQNG